MLVRTTTALTVVNAGQKANALPPTAKAIVNHRLLPGDSSESVLARDRAIVNDPRVTLTSKGATEASVVSDYTAPAFSVIAGAVERLFPNTVTAPSLMVGGTDCPWYTDVAEQLYRHCPTELKATETVSGRTSTEANASQRLSPLLRLLLTLQLVCCHYRYCI